MEKDVGDRIKKHIIDCNCDGLRNVYKDCSCDLKSLYNCNDFSLICRPAHFHTPECVGKCGCFEV